MNIEYGEQEKAQLATQLYQRHVKDCTVGCPKKSKSPNFGMSLTPVVFLGQMSHHKKIQHYRPINDIERAIFSFTL